MHRTARWADLAASYFRVGDVCLLCFDLANLASFDHIKWWQKKVRDVNEDCSFVAARGASVLLRETAPSVERSCVPTVPTRNGPNRRRLRRHL